MVTDGGSTKKDTMLNLEERPKTADKLALLAKVAGGTPLAKRPCADAKAVTAAGELALECGKSCDTLEEVQQFVPHLDAGVTYPEHPHRYYLLNRFVEGFAQNISSEADLFACQKWLKTDPSWFAGAEKALIKAAVPVLRSLDGRFDFIYGLSDSGKAVFTVLCITDASEK